MESVASMSLFRPTATEFPAEASLVSPQASDVEMLVEPSTVSPTSAVPLPLVSIQIERLDYVETRRRRSHRLGVG